MSISRGASLLLVTLYTAFSVWAGGVGAVLKLWLFLPFPLACIWYSEAMGQYSSPLRLTRPTPAGLVWLLGWVFLVAPVVVLLIWKK